MSADRPFPTKEEILTYLREAPTPVGKREIARAFAIKGADRQRLKSVLKELKAQGALETPERRKVAAPGALPEVAVLTVVGLDEDGETLARPVTWESDAPPPTIYLAPDKHSRSALGEGDRALCRLTRIDAGHYEARIIRRLGGAPKRVLGIVELAGEGLRVKPTDKRTKKDYVLRKADAKGAEPGELVLCEPKPHHARVGAPEVSVLEIFGSLDNQRALSLIAIHEHGLPTEFSDAAVEEAETAGPVSLGRREDLRALPLVTIDGADARDFDDAVFAEPDDDPKNPGGWHILVAIADVAHYVRPDGPLDREARNRGNSAYFPDRVVPMLPEALSNGWCSLKPKEERGCLACHFWIDAEGRMKRYRFLRGLMRSAARLTYEQVQAAMDGAPDELAGPLREPVIAPLYGAFRALVTAREARGTLDLDVPERRIVMDESGTVVRIEPRRRLDSHRLIEEFMVAANVAAASELESRQRPCMYRVHDVPDEAKVAALREILATLDLKLAKGQVIRAASFGRILEMAAGQPYAQMVSELILRSQSQAIYSPSNIGHFGLALVRYAHFTSPIRRYADLLVHRSLIDALGLGDDGLTKTEVSRFEEIAQHISTTERRAAAAERDAVDRLTAAFLKDRVGETFEGRVNGVTRFGLFVTLSESGGDGLVPVSSLTPADFYQHDERAHALVGRRWGRSYRLGETVLARLVEADPLTGGLILNLIDSDDDSGEGAGDTGLRHRAPSRKAGGLGKAPPKAKARAKGGKASGKKPKARR
ncbi:MAG: ribonuclease R [Tistlia sp.]|uniref:ribonuclease R n=1 Tax=Tistlia sp. TaxID=3057121 RepID=UPI0034A46F13